MSTQLLFPRAHLNLPLFVKPRINDGQKQGILKSTFRINSQNNSIFDVILFDTHIQIDSKELGKHRIQIQFENKFSINGKSLHFFRDGDNQLDLIFTGNSMQSWRKELGKRLCQKFTTLPFRTKKRISVRNLCAIYLAEQNNLDKGITQQIVVKAFRKSSLGTGEQYQDFKNEIKVMRSIKHPNLCRLINIYEMDNSYYLTMPYYEGGTLYDKNLKEHLTFNSIKDIIKQILTGLNYLHQKGIFHRDIKPQNILMQKQDSNQIAIIDFGFAGFLSEPEQLYVKCGTPGYVAPEIFKSSPKSSYNEKCDIFSLGILFYWLLTKKLPYSAKTQQEMKLQNYTFNIENKQQQMLQLKKFPALTSNLIYKMLKKDPIARISASEALKHQFFSEDSKQFYYDPVIQSEKYTFYQKEQCKYNF